MGRDLIEMDVQNVEEFKAVLAKFVSSTETLASRTGLLASLMTNAHNAIQAAAGIVSKAAPHVGTVSLLSIPDIPASSLSVKTIMFRKSSIPSETTEFIRTRVSSSPIQFRKRVTDDTDITDSQDYSIFKKTSESVKGQKSDIIFSRDVTSVRFRASTSETARLKDIILRNKKETTHLNILKSSETKNSQQVLIKNSSLIMTTV